MPELVADRFVAAGAGWLDLASGATVRLRVTRAAGFAAQLAWSDRCDGYARLRHPALNVLLDYGSADARRTFEAYTAGEPIRAAGHAGSVLLRHATSFLESKGLPLTSDVASLAVRQVVRAGRSAAEHRVRRNLPVRLRERPLGITVQDRQLVEIVRDVLMETSPSGVIAVDIVGEPGSGLRTMRTIAARMARLEGYVPICGTLLYRCPWLMPCIAGRHVCVLFGDSEPSRDRLAAARLVSDLAVSSARRHVFIRFRRTDGAGALHVGPLGVTAMMSMVFVDDDGGPDERELFDAARAAGGNPGRFLRHLGAVPYEDHVARAMIVHESPTPYVLQQPPGAVSMPVGGHSRRLEDAHERAVRLAARGRHASAVRLLRRAVHVLEARRESDRAATCAEQLGWILRDRGRGDLALEQFQQARSLARRESAAISAAISVGVVWTDQRRLVEAEAVLRSAVPAARLIADPDLCCRALTGLARSLYWQRRFEEALVLLEPYAESGVTARGSASRLALVARLRLGAGDAAGAVTAAAEAVRVAKDGRGAAAAARAMVLVQAGLGDRDAAREHARRGLLAAARAHLPLAALRLRAALLGALGQSGSSVEASRLIGGLRSALARRSLPPLLREQVETACATAEAPVTSSAEIRGAPSMGDIQQLLEIAHSAIDDHTAAEEICRALCDRLRAASVQVVTASSDRRLLARAGRPWAGDEQIFERVLTLPCDIASSRRGEPCQLAGVVQYGAEPIAILACRWAAGAEVNPLQAGGIVRAGALALGASIRGLLDRSLVQRPEAVWGDLIGTSPATAALRDAIARAARAPFPVLVEGESGSGKELVARAIHRLGPRRERRLCAVNCAAVADDLLEAELFGHARGAFTGAVGERAGLFEEADGGTLFLDEVGDLSPRAQAKLLRVLQEGEVRRVGENAPRRVDARVVAATNRRLEEDVENGRFRADLRFRLDVIRISVPPLRERPTDIPALAAHFWEQAAHRVGSRATLASETIAMLARYDWPGNVRQLQNALASLAVHAPRRGRLTPAMLPAQIARAAPAAGASFEAAREEFERRFVLAALARAGGHRARAAQSLGMSRQGLAKMLRRLRIEGE